MPEYGKENKAKKKAPKKEKEDSSEVVSAYSEEGQRRSQKVNKPLSTRFKVGMIICYVLLFVLAIGFIVLGETQGWF